MPRRGRRDGAGVWHHVTNRGVAKRTMFENRADRRAFLALLAREVRRGEFELHAYSLLHTHFHLLARSTRGSLSHVMRRVQGTYSRWFNRRRKRDGPLVRGRFYSKRVGSLAYRAIVVRYIDDNPVSAGLASKAHHYPYGSAAHYARLRGPVWLSRGWIEEEVRCTSRKDGYDPLDYERRFPSRLPPEVREWVETQLTRRGTAAGELDELIDLPPDRVLAWMRRKAKLADGTEPWQATVPARLLLNECGLGRRRNPDWPVQRGHHTVDGWSYAIPGLLRTVAGASLDELGFLLGVPRSTLRDRVLGHLALFEGDEHYSVRVADMAKRALRLLGNEAR